MSVKQQSPIVAFTSETVSVDGKVGVVFEQSSFNQFYNLRIDPGNSVVVSAVNSALGISLPLQPSTLVNSEGLTVYWLGPDEWLLRLQSTTSGSIVNSLKLAITDQIASLVDNSSGMTVIKVSGEFADYVLRQGMTFDIHPREFKLGQCAQTVMGKTNVLISCDGESGQRAYSLVIRRSFADYIMLFLLDAAATCGYELKT
ncbi:MAG: sarcosine oxidase subunit gamma [Parasphingorhabdus sp.]|jgi:sarcosine oxidase subunit gamma